MTISVLTRVEDLNSAIRQFDRDRLFLVADPTAYESSGAKDRLSQTLAQYNVRCFSDFEPNPKFRQVITGAKLLGSDSSDIIIAVGGGTALDVAKLISCFAMQEVDDSQAVDFFSQSSHVISRRHPLIAIPTTAGTGSEATQFAVVYLGETKHSISHPSLLPDTVVLDPTLTYSVPPGTTISTGLDAVSQAIESMWSIQSTAASLNLAEQALQLGLANLTNAVTNPQPESRAGMMQSAHLSGHAINISRTTAPHALSYTMTIKHKVPHGIAVALSIARFMRFNARTTAGSLADPRGMTHLQDVFERIAGAFQVDSQQDDAMDIAAFRWQKLLEQIGVNQCLSDWNITTAASRAFIAQSVNQQRLSNNPRKVTEQDLLKIVEDIA